MSGVVNHFVDIKVQSVSSVYGWSHLVQASVSDVRNCLASAVKDVHAELRQQGLHLDRVETSTNDTAAKCEELRRQNVIIQSRMESLSASAKESFKPVLDRRVPFGLML